MGYSVLLPVCYLSVVNSCPQKRKKIVGLILFHLRLSTLERLRMFVMLYWIVGGVLSGGLTGGLGVCWSEIKSLVNFIYVPVSVKRFLFVGGSDRLPRSPYLQRKWLVMEESLLHFQIKVGVVVWFSLPFYLQLHSIDLCHCFSMYMYLQSQYCVLYSLNINFKVYLYHNLCIYSSENEEK